MRVIEANSPFSRFTFFYLNFLYSWCAYLSSFFNSFKETRLVLLLNAWCTLMSRLCKWGYAMLGSLHHFRLSHSSVLSILNINLSLGHFNLRWHVVHVHGEYLWALNVLALAAAVCQILNGWYVISYFSSRGFLLQYLAQDNSDSNGKQKSTTASSSEDGKVLVSPESRGSDNFVWGVLLEDRSVGDKFLLKATLFYCLDIVKHPAATLSSTSLAFTGWTATDWELSDGISRIDHIIHEAEEPDLVHAERLVHS